ncbi:hypothetical protein [Trabulsiella odontotermitis]|uniref:AsnC family protein n=1 Tax=Trabulsiella odontotermitis TaxID=379893 RepID=A0A0L0H3I7_9ENTR|nr:hypothetical protein [Trabulsiella odontotermitis]KNC95757.1 hypothetical protein GM31_21845 [Trabulsiella odontotermitis]
MFLLKPMGIPGICPKHLRAWTQAEDAVLIENYQSRSLADTAALLPLRTISAVRNRAEQLRKRGLLDRKNKQVTPSELLFIKKNASRLTIEQTAKHLGRCTATITKTAYAHGISFLKLGDANPLTKHSDQTVKLVRDLHDDEQGRKLTFKEIAEKLEIPPGTIARLQNYRYTQEDRMARVLLP